MSAEQLSPEELRSNYDGIQQLVDAAAAERAEGPKPRLVAVSKLKPASDIRALHEHGVKHFGENYPQELADKAKELPSDIEWHFIGALQSNKAKMLASIPNLFAVETLTSVKAANHLQTARSALEPAPPAPLNVYLQLNTSNEAQKAGLSPDVSAESELLGLALHVLKECSSLRLKGLMTIGSFDNSTADGEKNPDFEVLVKAKGDLTSALKGKIGELEGEAKERAQKVLDEGLELSMGMSEDFEQAIKQGSGNVRVGSRIFGKRPPRKT